MEKMVVGFSEVSSVNGTEFRGEATEGSMEVSVPPGLQ